MRDLRSIDSPAGWLVDDFTRDPRWRFSLDSAAASHLRDMVKAAYDEDRALFDYDPAEFDLGPAGETIAAAAHEAYHGVGVSLVKGLPRDGLREKEFELLNWAVGLHTGVARPQGKASQYISAVRDAGTEYRAASGRGYSSNAGLDFHTDGCDLVTLACYNKAKSGGQSMVSSSVSAWNTLLAERPDLAEVAHRELFYFSRQNEQTEDEGLAYGQPLFDFEDGRLFGKWNRNRVRSAQDIPGVPPLTDVQHETCDVLDEILRRSDIMFTMYLEPGDLQFMNNHVMLHSRTEYEDFDKPEDKRLLFRLWLALPDSWRLPASWGDFFRSFEPGTVRGGIRGHNHDEACHGFERVQAARLGMPAPSYSKPIQERREDVA